MIKQIQSIVSVPFVVPGSVVLRPGLCAESGVFADFDPELMDDFAHDPTRAELVQALRQVWRPVCGFKLASPEDRGALLAALLGTVARPGLSDSPGVVFDAPCPGSGKTLAASVVGAVLLGRRPPITPFSGVDDAELKKQMVANCLDGFNWLLLDNVVGLYDSAVMAGVLTSGALRDRVLGSSLMFDGNVKLNVCLTSNNASLSRDLTRRFIRVRIDTGEEQPQKLSFSFDPVERALTERLAIARAICVLFQGFFAAGSPRLGEGDCGFPTWSRLVRSCVLWLQSEGLADGRCDAEGDAIEDDEHAGIGELGDPAHQIIVDAGRTDPGTLALGQLLTGLGALFPPDKPWFFARDLAALTACPVDDASEMIKDALEILCPPRSQLNARTVGNLLRYRVGTLCGGYKLDQRIDSSTKAQMYRVLPA